MPSIAESAGGDTRLALDVLAADGLVAFPTETVWGLAALAESPIAVDRLRAFKGRDADKPLAVLVDRPERLPEIGVVLGAGAARLAAAFWPGPLTIVSRSVPRSGSSARPLAPGVAGADGSIGIRCSPHPVAGALAAGALDRGLGPVTATSLNRSGEEPARTTDEALRVAARDPEIFVLQGEAGGAEPSTVVDATSDTLSVLREGAIAGSAIHALSVPGAARRGTTDDPETDSR